MEALDFDPEMFSAPPLYTLNLTAAQRSVLAWMEDRGAIFTPIGVPVAEVAAECRISESSVSAAIARLTSLRLIQGASGAYKINARYFFAVNPEIRALMAEAFTSPPVVPDERANQPRKPTVTDKRRRQLVRPVRDEDGGQ